MVMEHLDAAGKHTENQDPTRQFAIEQATSLLSDAEVKDPDPKVDGLPSATKPEIQDVDPLQAILETYRNESHTPELLTQTHKAIWQARGELVSETYEVVQCPYTQEEIAELEGSGKRVGYLPSELATQQTRHKLGEMFPKMQSYSVQEGNFVTNDENPSGWFDYETAIDAPYLDTKEKQLLEKVAKDERQLLSLKEYIVASQDSKLLTNKYLDETRTYVRLASLHDGRMVGARFNSDGNLNVRSLLLAGNHYSNVSGRSSGVK